MKNIITRVFCAVIAVLLTAFAPSALAAKPVTKTYVWSATVGGVNNTQTMTRIFLSATNTNPNNSSAAFGYVQIDLAAASGVTIAGFDPAGQRISPTSIAWTLNPKIGPNQAWNGYIDVNGCGDGQGLTLTVTTGLQGSNETFTSQSDNPQTANVPCLSVACGNNDLTAVSGLVTDVDVGSFALDGSTACQTTSATNIYVTDSGPFVRYRWANANNNKLAFFYTVGRPYTHLAWIVNQVTGLPIFDPALQNLACGSNGPTTPVPLATVTSDNGSPSKIKVNTTGFSTTLSPPFYITAQWMQGTTPRSLYALVTNTSGSPPSVQWTLGSFFPSPRGSVPFGTTIMSTVNPPTPAGVSPPYIAGSMALGCFAAQTSTSASIVDSDPEGNIWSSP